MPRGGIATEQGRYKNATQQVCNNARMPTSSSSSSAAATCVEVLHPIAEALGQLLRHDDCPHGEAVADGLAQCDYVRDDRLQLEAPEVAAHTPKAALNLQTPALCAAPLLSHTPCHLLVATTDHVCPWHLPLICCPLPACRGYCPSICS